MGTLITLERLSQYTALFKDWVNNSSDKVAKPTGNGTAGQMLRTKGDGTTEWADVGTPTDAQAEAAIENWLDEHPEATTTLEDGAVTYDKLHADVRSDITTLNSSVQTMNQDVSDLQTSVSSLENAFETISSTVSAINTMLGTKVDDWYIDSVEQALYLTANGMVVGAGGIKGIGGGSGGGSGGGDVAVSMTMTNSMNWLATTIRNGANCPVTFNWASTMNEVPTGGGILSIYVKNVLRATMNVAQGSVTVDLGTYLSAGVNSVRIIVSDVYGNNRSIVYTITSVALSLMSSFDSGTIRTTAFNFPYTPIGSVEKVMHFKLDGVEQDTVTTSVSNHQLSYPIPAQTHGNHSIEAWFTAIINEETVSSNHVYYEYVYAVSGQTTPVITCNFNEDSISQFSTIQIPYRVYDPTTQQCEVSIYEGDALKATLTVGREQQNYSYRATTSGEKTITFVVGSAEKEINFTVTAVDVNVEAETTGLQLFLSSQGRNNTEANPGTWEYDNTSAVFSGFNWTSDGWQQDDNGVTVLRVSGDARVTIPYEIFASDLRENGRTIEIEFSTHDVRNYDTPVITCLSGGRGITMNSQAASISSEQSVVSTQYKDNEHVRLSFVVQRRSDYRLILLYLNGVVSGAIRYPENDDFSQVTPVGISLGGADATLDVYAIRVYDHDLTRFQILNNWIADTQDGFTMLKNYTHNDIFDQYGNIVISQLPNDLPYMVLTGVLPTYKGNKLSISGQYVDPLNPNKSFTFENATIDVQGTSSQYYARKNYKVKFNDGFVTNGISNSKYAMNADAVPTKTFTFKADVASSEGANNVELARLYNDICPYRTPYQIANSKVRQGIDGFPVVIFHNDGTNTVFLGE